MSEEVQYTVDNKCLELMVIVVIGNYIRAYTIGYIHKIHNYMGGWSVSEFGTTSIVYLLIHTISISIVCLVEFGKQWTQLAVFSVDV